MTTPVTFLSSHHPPTLSANGQSHPTLPDLTLYFSDWDLLDREARDFKMSFNGVTDQNEKHYNKLNLETFRFATSNQVRVTFLLYKLFTDLYFRLV